MIWIDSTIWTDMEGFDEERFKELIQPLFDRYAYGREEAPTTGRKHLQFRGIFKGDKEALTNSLNYLASAGLRHITLTHVRNFDYVLKSKDFYLSWEIIREEYKNGKLCEWQSAVLNGRHWAKENEHNRNRDIEIFVDTKGNSGKTWFGRWLESRHLATYIPPLGRGTDILSAVIEKPKSEWYYIDFPKAFQPDRETWSAIEMVKNGVVYDHRYKYKEIDIGYNPRVTVMCNDVPKFLTNYLSEDRIKLYEITEGGGILEGRENLTVKERPHWYNFRGGE